MTSSYDIPKFSMPKKITTASTVATSQGDAASFASSPWHPSLGHGDSLVAVQAVQLDGPMIFSGNMRY